jgi:microcystin-dependent protein
MATVSGLNTFSAGTPAKASEVNTNFNVIKTFVEGLSTAANIDGGAITNSKLGPSAVTSDKISNNTIVYDDLAVALQRFLVPVGTISAYAGVSAPAGWLLCNGNAFSSATYPSLYSVLQNVAVTPNLIGKFPMGKTGSGTGSTLLGTGGTVTPDETQLPSHAHSAGTLAAVAVGNHGHTGGTDYAGEHNHTYTQTTVSQRTVFNAADQIDDVVLATAVSNTSTVGTHFHLIGQDGAHGHTISGATATKGSGVEFYQPFVAVNYIIKHD